MRGGGGGRGGAGREREGGGGVKEGETSNGVSEQVLDRRGEEYSTFSVMC